MKPIITKNFDFTNIKDISLNQLNQHYMLYTKYVKTMNKLNRIIPEHKYYENCSSNFSDIRNIQNTLSFNLNAVKLHELYFSNMTGLNTYPSAKFIKIIDYYFNSFENFIKQFKCIGMAMRGWVVLCYDIFTENLFIYGQDSHNTQLVMSAYPILVMDVYEHAYMIDFGINKEKYINIFLKNIDFNIVNRRLDVFYQ